MLAKFSKNFGAQVNKRGKLNSKGVKFHKTLAFKLFILLIILFVITFTLTTYLIIKEDSQQFLDVVKKNITHTGDIIKKSTHYSMLINRKDDVHHIIETLSENPELRGIYIYNKSGKIIYSTEKERIGTIVNIKSTECLPCHKDNGKPKMDLSIDEKTRIFRSKTGEDVIGLIIPIENQKECTACHVHPADFEILGVIDVRMSLKSMQERIEHNKKHHIMNSLLVTTVISLFSWIFIWFMVHTRVAELIKGTKSIASGNYDYKIQLKSQDELGNLANHFNQMTENLKKALNEIKELNENLNVRIEEKTVQLKQIYDHVNHIERIASLGKLAATVAHELNNPLEGILTYSKLIIKKLKQNPNGESDKLVQYLELIANESERCGKIVKNLLLFSRSTEANITTNDLVNIIERSIMLINHHLQLNNITLEKDFCCTYLEFDCDKNQIQQALIALLLNAIEAMPDGGKLRIELKCMNSHINLSIIDTGIGIPKENMSKIFEPFFSTKAEGKGTGLGLSVVYGIVKRHNGMIKIDSEVNRGTKFTVVFPKKQITDYEEVKSKYE